MPKKSRQTRQKETILCEMEELTSFFTAEELFERVKKKETTIGIATIYRFLKDTKKKGGLHAYSCGKKTIYSKQANNHCHFICEKCGKNTHFNVQSLDFLKTSVPGSICHFQVDVHGICRGCKAN